MTEAIVLKKERMEILNFLDQSYQNDISHDVFDGMQAEQKCIPSKYFYDHRGSRLFERICRLSEYYPTRKEMEILERFAPSIMKSFDQGDLVELGSGANWKIQRLLDTVEEKEQEKIRYVPVDVSESALVSASQELLELYEKLNVLGIVADFTKQMEAISTERSKLILFLGSTIGNLNEEKSHEFLKGISSMMNSEDRCLIGLDMAKEKQILEDAYNDREGITSEFNKNILSVVNRELHADFDPSQFDHVAFFNEEESQIEMHLQAKQKVKAEFNKLPLTVEMDKGETIQTEISRKFHKESAEEMFSRAGLDVAHWYSDHQEWFSLVELTPSSPGSIT